MGSDGQSNIVRFSGAKGEVMEWLRQHDIRKVRVEWTDLHGISRGKRMPPSTFEHALEEGLPFAALLLAIDVNARWLRGTPLGEEIGFGDYFAWPDLSSLRVLRHEPGTAQCMAAMKWPDGRPVAEYPRNVLHKVLARLDAMDLVARAAPEFEFYYLNTDDQTIDTGANAYSMQKRWVFRDEEEALIDASSAHVDHVACNYEYGPGQYEMTIGHDEASRIADAGHLFRSTMKEAAMAIDRHVTFMAKPFDTEAGSSCHWHFSLEDKKGNNVFRDAGDPLGLSPTCRHFIGGVLAHLEELALLYLPTPNSYRRLAPDSFAPLSLAWGVDNRVAAVRVVNHDPAATRMELRVTGGDVNVYLALAAIVASGIDGIENRIDPGAEAKGHLDYDPDVPKITNEWGHALSAFENSDFARTALGEEFHTLYTGVKRMEYERVKFQVSTEEREELIEMF